MAYLFFLSPALGLYALTLVLLLGLCLGSFLNCLAYRMAHGENAFRGRSHCPQCAHVLAARELVPLFSYLLQKGRCRACGHKIAPRYPLVELLAAALLLGLVLRYGFTWTALQLGILTLLLLGLALVDLDTGYIPNSLLLAGVANFFLFLPLRGLGLSALGRGLVGGLAISAPLLLLSLLMDKVLKRESMGGGDIKLFFVLGLYLPISQGLLTLIFACVLGILFPLLCKIRTEEGENAFPFGPAIAAAAYLAFLTAEPLVGWYLSLF